MTEDFDPYHKWLSIPKHKRPPSFYELLGIGLDEEDREVIEVAYHQRSKFVESQRGLGHEKEINEILFQLQEAKLTVLNPDMRRDYDRRLNLFLKRRKNRRVDLIVPRTRIETKSNRIVGEESGILNLLAGILIFFCIAFGVMAWFSFQLPWGAPLKMPVVAQPNPQPNPVPVVQPAVVAPDPQVEVNIVNVLPGGEDHIAKAMDARKVEAADIKIEGEIKKVSQNTIAIQRMGKQIDLELSNNVEVIIDGRSSSISSLENGSVANITFNSTLEIVTKITIGDESKSLKPTISVLSELDGRGQESHPWLSRDGMTIYWTSSNSQQNIPRLNIAHRGDLSSFFEEIEETEESIPTMDFTLSEDELEIIMFLDKSLHQSTRKSVNDRFGRPTRLSLSLRGGFLAGPCLSRDGLRLYCDGIIKGRGSSIHVSERKSNDSNWLDLIPLRLPYRGVVKYPFISDDELLLFCTAKDINLGSNILVFARKDVNSDFDSVGFVELDGETIRGIFPRYCAKTNELVYASDDLKLMLVRGFDPKTMVKPLR